jgi:endonuclease YncB( thermonuclease family)
LVEDTFEGKTSAGINNTNLQDVGLQEGVRVRCLLGNSVISDELGLEFTGRIAAINGKDIIEIYCVSDGHELIQNTIGYEGDEKNREYTLNSDTTDLIKEVLADADEVKSFGNTKLEVIKNISLNLPEFLGGRSAFDNIYAPTIHPKYSVGSFASGAFNSALSTFSTGFGVGVAFKGLVAMLGLVTLGKLAAAAAVIGGVFEIANVLEKTLYPCKFIVSKQTLWDVLQELTLRHPGYICAVVPFDRRSTLYFGEPDGIYFCRGVETAAEKAIVAQAMMKSGALFKTATLREIYENNVNQKNENPKVDESSNPFSVPNAKNKQKSFQENFVAKNSETEKLTLIQMQKSFRSYHLVTSENDIVSNDIEASSVGVANSVQIYHPTEDDEINPDGQTWFSSYKLTDRMKADDDLHSNLVNNKVFTFHNAHNEYPEIELPQRYAKAVLCKELENIYKGKITILGRHGIKPHDIVIINDTHNRISGPVKVGRVVQSISPETGWVTHIYPKFIAIPDTSAGSFQMKAILKAARYWLGTNAELFYSNMKKFTPDETADSGKADRELEKAMEMGFSGNERVSEESMLSDFTKDSIEKEGEYSINDYQAGQDMIFASGQAAGSYAAGVNGRREYQGLNSSGARMTSDGTVSGNQKNLLDKAIKDGRRMTYTKKIEKSVKALGEKKSLGAAKDAVFTSGKGAFRAAKIGGRLFVRTGVGFAGGFILESFLSSMIEGIVSYMKYREPISIFPLTKEGKPWMAALNGYKENSIIEHLELSSVKAADRLGMTSYVIQKFFKEWTDGSPADIGVGVEYSFENVNDQVIDGDTFKIKNGSKIEKIRIKGANTGEVRAYPEYNKPAPRAVEKEMGEKAKARLKELIQKNGNKVTIERHGVDGTGTRTEATVKISGIDVRSILLEEGLAMPSSLDYSKKLAPELRTDQEAVAQAREAEWVKLKKIYEQRKQRNR